MRTRRSVLLGVTATISLAGCSQQEGQPSEESGTDTEDGGTNTASSELSLEAFRVDGEPPEEYEPAFGGSSPEEVVNEINPELSYQVTGADGEIETEIQFEYSELTNPDGAPLNDTIQGETHNGDGKYTQKQGLPDSIDEDIFENPRNIQAEFTAEDTETGQTQTQQYELNLADNYIEQATKNVFNNGDFATTDAELRHVSAEDGKIEISYKSQNERGTREFEGELAGVGGGYSEGIKNSRIPYSLEVNVEDSNGEEIRREVGNENAQRYLNGEIDSSRLGSLTVFNKLLEK